MIKQVYETRWQNIDIRIEHEPKFFWDLDHIKIYSADRVPLPITATGFKSIFLPYDQLTEYGGPVSYIKGLLDEQAQSKEWINIKEAMRQYALL